MVSDIRIEKLYRQLAALCAPTFLCVKPSNLLMLPPEDEEVLKVCTQKEGIRLEKLYCGNQREMWLLYRREDLEQILRKKENAEFFREMGYRELALDKVFERVKKRLFHHRNRGETYPHELGILLGYPVEDVRGFIRNRGRNYLCSGYWKVYQDEENAKKRFGIYDAARKQMMRTIQTYTGENTAAAFI